MPDHSACLPAEEFGYPTSTLQDKVPETDADKTALVDELQAWKTTAYQDLIGMLLLRSHTSTMPAHM